MRTIMICALMLPFVIGLASCSDPKAANKDNFQKVLQTHFDKNKPICVPLRRASQLPLEMAKNDYAISKIDALVTAGLLTKTPATVTVTSMFTFGDESKEKQVEGFIYDATPMGKEFVTKKSNAFTGDSIDFCFGKLSNLKVDSFTEPANAGGYTISSVKYSYKVDNIPQWVQTEAIQTAFPYINKEMEKTSGNTALVLMGDGWAHEKNVK